MSEVDRLVKTRPSTPSGSGRDRARGLVSNRASGQRVGACSYVPPDDLSDVVLNFWRGSWDQRGEPGSLAALAADLGFTDQSHFARDFKRATGKTPAYSRETVHDGDAMMKCEGGASS